MSVRQVKTLEGLAHEIRMMGPQGRGDGWIPFTDIYVTGWEDYGAGYEDYGYRRVGDTVEIELLCKRTSGTSLTIATLPAAFWPERRGMRLGLQNSSTPCRFDIYANGDIWMVDVTGSFAWVSISCSFYSPINRR